MNRRDFFKIVATGGAAAAAAGCQQATETILPLVVPNEQLVPGVAAYFATVCRECPAGCGMSIRTREGRAVKAEGNPLSPISHGALCARGQASLHGLYNPDRIPGPLAREGDALQALTWDDAEQRLAQALAQNRGRTVLLTHNLTGTLDRLFDEFAAALGIERVRYEPFAWEPIRAANRLLFGQDAVPVHDFSNADLVLTFGAGSVACRIATAWGVGPENGGTPLSISYSTQPSAYTSVRASTGWVPVTCSGLM